MILVTLGTQDKSFRRLLDTIEEEIINGTIKEQVIVQAGFTKYDSKNMLIFDLIPMDEFEKLVSDCRLLITHAGVGSILTGLKNNKKVIAVPRLSKYNEHTNDHQLEIMNEFYNQGYLLKLEEMKDLGKVLKEVETFKPKKYVSNNQNMIKIIEDYISTVI